MLGELTAVTLATRTAPDAENLDPFPRILRSPVNLHRAEVISAGLRNRVGRYLADRLPEPNAAQCVELLLFLIAEVWLMREVMGTPG